MKKRRFNLPYARGLVQYHLLKIKMVFGLVCALAFSVSASTFAQNERVTFHLTDVSIKHVLNEIQKQTQLSFIYNTEQLGHISVEARNEEVASLLDRIFANTGLTWKMQDAIILISQSSPCAKPQSQNEEFIQFSGIVTDASNTPLPGVTVKVQGSMFGTTTDANGKFRLNYPKSGSSNLVLEFSFIGMRTEKVKYAGQKEIKITLYEDEVELEEAIVTGYQVLDKRTLTSSITSVKAEDIMIPGVMSIDQMLEGRIPDMAFMLNSGEVGATPRLRVRGTSTLLGNREPLWVLDGIVMTDPVDVDPEDLNNPDYLNIIGNAIAGINPQDIERIDVLKDASATALYGTRAANGVIVVTTKKGRIGKPVLSYNHSSKFTRRPRYTDRNINLMNSQERVEFGKALTEQHYIFPAQMPLVGYEGALYRLQTGQIDYNTFLSEVTWYEQVNTDWFDLLTRDTYSHNHSLNINGGSDIIRYYASLGYDRGNGVSNTTYTERYTVTANMNIKMTSKLNVGVKLNGNVQKKNHLASNIDAMDYAYNTTRALPAFNEDGSLYYYERYKGGYSGGIGNKYLRYNILNEIDNSSNSYEGKGIQVDLNLKYDILPTWDVTGIASYSVSSTLQEKWWGDKTAYIASLKNGEYEDVPMPDEKGKCILPYGGIIQTTNSDTETLTARLQSNYRKLFGGDQQHLITATLGYEVNIARSKSMNNESRGYVKERGMQFTDMSSLELEDFPYYKEWLQKNHLSFNRGLTNSLSFYLAVTYSYRDYFTLNINGRTDASNKFGSRSNERFLPIWSASGMWNARETLLKDASWLSEARMRFSYGKQGNMLDGQTPNLLINQQPINSYYNENISNVAQFPNPNLKWEETQQINAGFDIGFFNGRLNIIGDFYWKKTDNLFSWVNVAKTNGINSYVMNNGDLKNVGYSLSLQTTPVKIGDFSWRLSTSYSTNKNTAQTDAVENYELSHYLSGTATVSGEAVGTFYSYKFLGLNDENGVPVFDDYTDRRHLLEDKRLEDVVRLVMDKSGTREPIMNGNVFNTFTWKGITLSFNLAYSLGSKVRLFALYEPIISGVSAENNVRKEFINRWQVPGDEKQTVIPAILSRTDDNYDNYNSHWSKENGNKTKVFAKSLWNMYDNSDIRVVSGNYLKMQSLTLRYSLQKNVLKKTPFSSASISFNTQNLFTISTKALKGQDPSQAGFSKPNLSIRPAYTLGINVSF